MFTKFEAHLTTAIKWLLFATAFAPLLYSGKFFFPYVTQKLFFVRGVIVIALGLALTLFFLGREARSAVREKLARVPKFILVFGGIFIISQILSTVFAEFSYRAFWGTLERGQGLFNLLNFVVLFILLVIFFTKKDFRRYFEFSLAVGFVVYFYAILQALKITQFPFAFAYDPRAGSFLGNGAFLAAYSFFVMMAALITLHFSRERKTGLEKFFRNLSFITIILTPIIIFLTRTRGALVGLFVIVVVLLIYFAFKKPSLNNQESHSLMWVKIMSNRRAISVSVLLALIIFGATIFFTREAPLWQKVPGIDRLTHASILDDPSTRVRLLGWEMALRAFLEKPIFGWGPEHYIRVFETRYNTEFSVYGEVWLDRSHNSILDVASTQGILGVIGYVGFLCGMLWFFFRKRIGTNLKFSLGVIFLGFIVQSLFLLEEFHIFTPFFVLMGAIAVGLFSSEKDNESGTTNEELSGNRFLIRGTAIIGSIFISALTIFTLYKTVFVPTVQAYYTHKIETPKNKEEFFHFWNRATKPYGFTQYSIRSYLFDFYFINQATVFTDSRLSDVAKVFTDSINELINKEGSYDIRSHIRLNQAHHEMAKQDVSEEEVIAHYKAGEEVLRKALEISPLKQELIYGLALALVGQGKYDEAIKVMEKSIESNPRSSKIARLHFYYGLILSAAGRGSEAIEAFEVMRRADPGLTKLFPNDVRGLFSIYESLGEYERIIKIITASAKGEVQAKIALEYYEIALSYYVQKEDSENVIAVAKFIVKAFPERKEDMEAIIDLAEEGAWDILKSL